MLQTTWLDLIRHGEPVGGKRFRGSTDDPLSEAGWRHMRSAIEGLSGWQAVVTSPLSRCREFAEEVGGQRSIPVEIEPRLAEMAFGEWEGRSTAEVEQQYPDALRQFYYDPFTFTSPGGESMQDFYRRVSQAWADLLQRFGGRHVLVVAHGGVNRIILQQILDFPPQNMFRIQMDFAAMAHIRVDDDGERQWPRIKKITAGF